MGPTDALAKARQLLTDGFIISAANVLVDDAREAARQTLEPPGSEPRALEAGRDSLVHALGVAAARLQQHREAMRDEPLVEEAVSAPKKGRRQKGE